VLSTGTVGPKNQLEIKPSVSGRVEKLLIAEGAFVRKGQVLAQLSSNERAALLDAARAQGAEETAKWEDLYKPTPLLAPLSGLIIALNVVPGQMVSTGDALMVMSDHLIVRAQVDETDLAQVKVGQKALLTLDAYPESPAPASVRRIAFQSKLVNNVTTYEVEVWPEKVPPFMRSGMTANVLFQVAKKEGILLAPSEALQQRGGRTIALLAPTEAKGKPTPQAVKVGITDGKRTEILEGLKEGDQLSIRSFSASQGTSAGTNPFMPQRPGARATRTSGGNNRGGNR
jgi:macrolide-specific efflux system membrane fusion protein